MKNPFLIKPRENETGKHTILLNDSTLQLGFNTGQLEVRDGKDVLDSFPIIPLRRVVVFGNPQITTQAVKACLKNGVRILYHDSRGGFIGMTDAAEDKDVERRLAQYRLVSDESLRLNWSKALIRAKIRGAAIEFRRMSDNRWHHGDSTLKARLRRIAEEIGKCRSTAELFGVEGLAAREYFAAFGQALPPETAFKSRAYRPATDPVNALLSFTYGIAKGAISAACRQNGLDTGISFMHRCGYGGGGLATDLIEPFRHAWCDHQVLYAVHHRILTARDFEMRSGGCRLADNGRAAYLELCGRRLLPRLEKALRAVIANFNAALEHPENAPDFAAILPER